MIFGNSKRTISITWVSLSSRASMSTLLGSVWTRCVSIALDASSCGRKACTRERTEIPVMRGEDDRDTGESYALKEVQQQKSSFHRNQTELWSLRLLCLSNCSISQERFLWTGWLINMVTYNTNARMRSCRASVSSSSKVSFLPLGCMNAEGKQVGRALKIVCCC
jgi:hypothetical protein